jgi:Cu(I)/Ag(I) efflux system membrane fusion protein
MIDAVRLRSAGIGAAILGALLTALLLMQHLRHSWPFSLHHGPDLHDAPPSPEGRSDARAAIELDRDRARALGVRFETVRRATIAREIRAPAVVAPDESRLAHVHARFAGWVERLYVSTSGAPIEKGRPVADIYSLELLAAQSEYLVAKKLAAKTGANAALEGARTRLRSLGMGNSSIAALEARGEPHRTVTVSAPRSGIVLHRGVTSGASVDPGTEIVTIADLARVWVFAEVPEADIPLVAVGSAARIDLPASGRAPFEAKVAFVYPTLSERTRTLRVRFELDNADGTLRPGLYGNARFRAERKDALLVPRDAVVDTGSAQHVFVAHGSELVPRRVALGVASGDHVEVREGLAEGEEVVAAGVFLIDSESRLRGSGAPAGHDHTATPGAGPSTKPTPSPSPRKPPPTAPHQHH